MNEITIFKNERFGEVRTATSESGEPLFAAVDVARALGYANTRDAISKHCKGVVKRDGVARTTNQHGVVTNQVVEMSFINEGDVLRLIMRSKLPQAEAFQDWVCEEILPSIRKHGAYMTPETVVQMFQNPDALIQLLTTLKNEQEQNALLRAQREANAKAIEAMQPKAEYFDTVLSSSSLITTNTIAAKLGISAQRLNKFLCESGIQYKQSGLYFLYSDLRGKGLEGYQTFARTDSRTGEIKTIEHMYWTEKGAYFIINLYQETTSKLLN